MSDPLHLVVLERLKRWGRLSGRSLGKMFSGDKCALPDCLLAMRAAGWVVLDKATYQITAAGERALSQQLALIPKPQKSHKKQVPSASYRTDTMIEFNPALALRLAFFKRPLVERGGLCS